MSRSQTIAESLRAGIHAGTYARGCRLPSLRALAKLHGAGLNTVAAAMRLLQSEGLLIALPRSGFRVVHAPDQPRADAAAPGDIADVVMRAWRNREVPGMVVLSNCILPPTCSPVVQLKQEVLQAVETGLDAVAHYPGLPGRPPLRRALARHLRTLGAQVDADDILITNGAMEAVRLALLTCSQPGDSVIIESPAYAAHLHTLNEMQLRPLPVPVDGMTGIDCAALARALEQSHVAAVLCSPVFGNPHGGCLEAAGRQELLRLCAEAAVPIIEDDANGELTHRPPRPPPLLADDGAGLVLHAGSLTKTLGAGLQLGFLVPGERMTQASRHKVALNLSTGIVPQLIATALLTSPQLPRLQAQVSETIAAQLRRCRALILEAFPAGCTVSEPAGGLALWISMPGIDGDRLYADGIHAGIRANPGSLYGVAHRHSLRIACACWNTEVESAIRHLGRLARHLARG